MIVFWAAIAVVVILAGALAVFELIIRHNESIRHSAELDEQHARENSRPHGGVTVLSGRKTTH